MVVSAALGSSASARLIELAGEAAIELFSSAELLVELKDVLGREHIQQRLVRDTGAASAVAAETAAQEHGVRVDVFRIAACLLCDQLHRDRLVTAWATRGRRGPFVRAPSR